MYANVGTGDRNTNAGAYALHTYIVDSFLLASDFYVISDMLYLTQREI